ANKLTEFYKDKSERKNIENALLFSKDAIDFIAEYWEKEEYRKIAVWGLSRTAYSILDYLENEGYNVELVEIYDTYKAGREVFIYDKKYVLKEPSNINLDNDYFVFVASNSASQIAKLIFSEINKKDYYLCELKFITNI
ncbi:MAG: hypothetical protein PUE71_00585, partial [Clostridia bacterium]|nr:hypothetical protein [Clostridia bacterium]